MNEKTDQPKLEPGKAECPTVKSTTIEYLEGTTAHGVGRTIRPGHVMRKIAWVIIFGVAFGYNIYQGYNLIKKYRLYDVTVKTKLNHRSVM